MKTIKVDNKTYTKTMTFGNQKLQNIAKNKKKYNRRNNPKPSDYYYEL